jgi:hypothetical protein
MDYFLWLSAESCFDSNETLYCGLHDMKHWLMLMKLHATDEEVWNQA